MNIKDAVILAQHGKREGFNYIYKTTYKDKYYLALKFVKNEIDAQDILQDSYTKVFVNIKQLKDPNSFKSWLNMIVANNAKNLLRKKDPTLFSDMNTNEDSNEKWEENIVDENIVYRPEESYSNEETKDIVHKLINSLSDEQRLCLIMFYFEQMKIKDIASALNCNENTVKSRLNYGKKNLKIKAQELQKKGYKLYSIAPVALLLYLLNLEKGHLIPSIKIPLSGSNTANLNNKVNNLNNATNEQSYNQQNDDNSYKHQNYNNQNVGSSGTQKVVSKIEKVTKKGFIHTFAGKVTAAIVSLGIVCGGTAVGINTYNNKTHPSTSNIVDSASSPVSNKSQWRDVSDKDYPNLVAGNLTKKQLESILSCGLEKIENGKLDDNFVPEALLYITSKQNDEITSNSEISFPVFIKEENTSEGKVFCDKNILNNIFSVYKKSCFNDGEKFSEKDINSFNVQNETVTTTVATVPWKFTGNITSAKYNESEMIIDYDVKYDKSYTDTPEQHLTFQRQAHLNKEDDGYRITDIKSVETTTKINNEKDRNIINWKNQFIDTLKYNTADNKTEINKSSICIYRYYIYDMDKDGIPELFISTTEANPVDGKGVGKCNIYKYSDNSINATILQYSDKKNIIWEGFPCTGSSDGELFEQSDSVGVYNKLGGYAANNWEQTINKLIITNNEIDLESVKQYEMNSNEYKSFRDNHKKMEFNEVDNLTPIIDYK